MSSPSATADLIPAHRFGPLLAEARLRKGVDLAAIAEQSSGQFTVGELAEIEVGRNALREDLLPVVSALYGVDCGRIVPHRAKLFLDVTARHLRVGTEVVQLKKTDEQHILDRYLSLVYMLRNITPGTEIPLRGADLAILEASLHERAELIEERLLAAMAANDPVLATMLARFKNKLWVPGAGLLVGAVGLGALVFASQAEAEEDSQAVGGGDVAPNELVVDALVQQPAPVVNIGLTEQNVVEHDGVEAAAPEVAAVDVKAEALALVGLDLEATFPGWSVEFRNGVDGFHGMTFALDKRIEIYVQPGDTADELAGVIAHELGHAFDLTYLDDTQRIDWMNQRGITTQWWVGNGVNDFAAGQGDFAETFAAHLTGDHVHHDSAGELSAADAALLDQMLGSFLHAS